MDLRQHPIFECEWCGFRSRDGECFVLGDDDVFRCNVCDDEWEDDDVAST